MKPRNTERRAAVKSVAVNALLRLLAAAGMLWLRTGMDGGVLSTLLLILAVLDLLTLPASFAVLVQRLREIERGELDEARKY